MAAAYPPAYFHPGSPSNGKTDCPKWATQKARRGAFSLAMTRDPSLASLHISVHLHTRRRNGPERRLVQPQVLIGIQYIDMRQI